MFLNFGELMDIIFKFILSAQLKHSLFFEKTTKDTTLTAFDSVDIFENFKTHQELYIFLHKYCFLFMILSKLKLILLNLKIGIPQIFRLGEEQKIRRGIKLKLAKIDIIFT